MSDESVAEKVYEAGIEIVNPGGRPDVLRDAARGWRSMNKHLESMFSELDKQVENTLGDHWRGDSADAFKAHWSELAKAVDETLPVFAEAAKGLDEAADSIEEINDEIHQIYLEIGVSVAAGVALSFVTLGFGAAAGAANAARLAAQAARAATRLGAVLSKVARAFRAVQTFARAGKWQRFLVEMGTQYTGGFASGVGTSIASGKGPEWRDNAINAGYGALGGAGAGAAIGGRLGGGIIESTVSGGLGGAGASVVGDLTNNAIKGDDNDATQITIGAVAGGLGGAAGGAATHHAVNVPGGLNGTRELGIDVGINGAVGLGTGEAGNDVKDAQEDAAKGNEKGANSVKEKPDTEKFGAFG
ncbi:WXG100 family type VII secretion target [Streptomyces sp. NPDC002790]|uniref:WXG100 family type VII secretion target n=1 Tax=Streptomyces sp. NPDC002790 TaxID=3154431 RepID=UPI00332BFBD9